MTRRLPAPIDQPDDYIDVDTIIRERAMIEAAVGLQAVVYGITLTPEEYAAELHRTREATEAAYADIINRA